MPALIAPSFTSFPSLNQATNNATPKSRKRILDDTPPIPTKRSRTKAHSHAFSSLSSSVHESYAWDDSDVVARLVVTDEGDVLHVIEVTLGNPTTVGRSAQCNYVVKNLMVSSIHFRLYAVKSSEGGIMVSCEDLSSNGLVWNDHKIRRAAIILHHGDVLQIPGSQVFQVEMDDRHAVQNKAMPFDPTPPQRPRKQKTVGGYVITSHTLGTGNFAKVLLGHDPVKHCQVACKAIKTSKLQEIKRDVMKEVNILRTLKHPNINRVLGYQEGVPWTYIFLELSTGGDLFTYITSQHMLQEGEAKFLGYQLMLGLIYMHESNVSHRDLKPENILIYAPRAYPRVQIADFGLARDKAHEPAFSAVGTIGYLPPEAMVVLTGWAHEKKTRGVPAPKKGYDGKKVDCWSLGVVLYMMLCGAHPFDLPSESQCLVPDGASQPTISQGSLSQQSEAAALRAPLVRGKDAMLAAAAPSSDEDAQNPNSISLSSPVSATFPSNPPKPPPRPKFEMRLKSILDDLTLRVESGTPVQTPSTEAVPNPFSSFSALASAFLSSAGSATAKPQAALRPPAAPRTRRLSRSSSRIRSTSGLGTSSPPLVDFTLELSAHANGGLNNAIKAAEQALGKKIWVGVLDVPPASVKEADRPRIQEKLRTEAESVPVWVTDEEFHEHYDVFCHQVLWPSLHYAIPDAPKTKTFYESTSFRQYEAVNQKFADAIVQEYQEGDV
ncbi:Meiosis-specific serine/threonine-protein kinase mek1, partial [Ceratobasidium sp. 392]